METQVAPVEFVAPRIVESFEDALIRFLRNMEEYRRARYAKEFPGSLETWAKNEWQLAQMKGGKRFIRIATGGPNHTGSVFCFVEVATGKIFKAASYKAPAKHARGTIYASAFKEYGCGEHGANYIVR